MLEFFRKAPFVKDNMGRTYIDFIDKKIMPFVSYPGYDCRYPTLEPIYFSRAFYDEIRNVSEKMYRIFAKATKTFQKCPEKFMEDMEIPQKLIPYMNIPNVLELPTWLSRFDFVFDKEYNLHMVEINADTPCAVVESYYGNQVAADFFSAENPNVQEYGKLKSFMSRIIDKTFMAKVDLFSGDFKNDTFLFSCFHDYIEDYATTIFLKDTITNTLRCNTKFETFYDLAINDGYVECRDKTHPLLVYRLHPMEHLIEEKSTDGDDLGVLMLNGYKEGKFQMMNPPEAIIMQSKGFQALVWALANIEDSPFTQSEKSMIKSYLPPSYFERDFVPSEEKYIVKPIWGREGNGISVIDRNGVVVEKVVENPEDIVQRDSVSCLYQKFIDQPTFALETDYAKDDPGYLTLSCFMLGDRASAVYARYSYESIAGTEAFWVPLLTE